MNWRTGPSASQQSNGGRQGARLCIGRVHDDFKQCYSRRTEEPSHPWLKHLVILRNVVESGLPTLLKVAGPLGPNLPIFRVCAVKLKSSAACMAGPLALLIFGPFCDRCYSTDPNVNMLNHELSELQGSWTLKSLSFGSSSTSSFAGTPTLRFQGQSIDWKFSNGNHAEDETIDFAIDPSRAPKHLDLLVERHFRGIRCDPMRFKGIYLRDGDKLTICVRLSSKLDRPESFEPRNPTGSGIYTVRLVLSRNAQRNRAEKDGSLRPKASATKEAACR